MGATTDRLVLPWIEKEVRRQENLREIAPGHLPFQRAPIRTGSRAMGLSRQILAKTLTSRWYYAGTLFSFLSLLFNQWDRSTAGPDSIDGFELAAFACLLISLLSGALLMYQLRPHFVTVNRNLRAFEFCRAWALFYVKAFALVSLASLPFLTLIHWLHSQGNESPSPELRTMEWLASIGLLIIGAVAVLVVHNGGGALVLARGHSHHCIRDSINSFTKIWKEVLACVGLMFVPALISLPFHLLSSAFPAAHWIVDGLDFAFIPYQFALTNGGFLFFAHKLRERSPEFQEPAQVQSLPRTQASVSEAKSFSTP